ncbi:alkylation response protein AidB-like acyl-CoA dehydrogenase [Peribacillus deserti]|uniref:Alkylation response protein AidB-like acyl-CoA dehydrogenase n=1 Tax=Peribacillus deserti TaxID=673318 RepID=A0ABS2QHW3_9BACI|nr:acyl-CoA dehydrogenase family protein [Peribacillus deserti]MBM7692751.1 alkylation response protein AidB-like acyl-CoA dehydrogenase [Peribacillus deserti]
MNLQKERSELKERNFYACDETLQLLIRDHLDDELFQYADKVLSEFGKKSAGEIDERARHTDREGQPRLVKYNKMGDDISEVWVNEGYRKTVAETYETGIVGYVHKEIPELGRKGNYTYSFALGYVLSQSEPGFYCPVTLTMATAYLLDHYADDAVKEKFLKHVCATGDVSLFEGATFLTERQGGSDVGANVVKAVEEGGHFRLYGEKYFASNAGMCGVAMVLARIEGAPVGSRGLTLFAVPWRNDDGSLNGISIRRLKDKLGVRAVPSGEVEFDGARAYVVGDPKRGFYYMMEALNLSRICNAAASVGIMQRALLEAKEYASNRKAFGKSLAEFPMVQDALGKLTAKHAVELAAIFDMIKLYQQVTDGNASVRETVLNRLFIAILKKETAEQSIHFSHEAIEMHGGNGFIEDFVTPRLLRDAQVLTVWEGTANILGLEVIRLVNKFQAHTLFIDEMSSRLEKLPDGYMKDIVEKKLADLSGKLDLFARLDSDMQTYEAKTIAKEMAHLYESIISLQMAEKFGDKYSKLAEIFIEMTWNLRNIGDEMKTVRYFSDVVI